MMRARRGPGAAAHGPRLLPQGVRPNRWRVRGAGTGRGSKTGRRPLLGPPARLGRALSQKIGAPSMHTPGHTRGPAGPAGGKKSPADLGGG